MPLGLELSFLKKASYFVRNVEKKVSHLVIGAFVAQTVPDWLDDRDRSSG